MPIPATIDDLSPTASSNGPAGSETPTDGDGYLRAHAGFIAELRNKLNGTSNTGTVKNAAFSGTQTGAASWSGEQTFSSVSGASDGGVYLPDGFALTNVASVSTGALMYTRGNESVSFSGYVSVTPSGAGTIIFEIEVPVASDFTTSLDASGVAVGDDYSAAYIGAGTANNRLQFTATVSSALPRTYRYSGHYEVK